MSDLVVNVRQVSSYALGTPPVLGTDAVLLQRGGLGGPYLSASAATLVSTALAQSSIGVGQPIPADAAAGNVLCDPLVLPLDGVLFWNVYSSNTGWRYLTSGLAGAWSFGNNGWNFDVAPVGSAGAAIPPFISLLSLTNAGALNLPYGTLTVARDPASALEVATMGYVGSHTVASFNGRNGAVQLWSSDIYGALCLDSAIATQNWVNQAITAAIQNLLMTCAFVNRWNGRTGSVYLTLSDITCVFFQPGQQPISPTPPTTSNDNSIATTAWVTSYVTETIAGDQGLATQTWVQANTVASFNGRNGAVTLNIADITGAGGAPINSPQLSGVPTAPTQPTGNAGAAIATTAFVWNAVQESTTGVVSWNGRTGVITLESTDINDAGGALLNSPAFSGTPTAPTASTGTATTQLATCAFVLNEVQAIGAGVTTFNTRSGNVVLNTADITGAGGAPIASPAFSGTPTVPSPLNPLQGNAEIANTQWVVQYVSLQSVSSFNSRTGAVTLNANDITGAGGLANPNVALTGVPTAPTAAPNTNTTQVATTAYVTQAIGNVGGNYVPLAGNVSITGPLTMNGATATLSLNGNAATPLEAVPLQQLTSTLAAYAPLASPALTGTPTAPTAVPGTNNTDLATTAFVAAAIAANPVVTTTTNYADNSGFTVNQRAYASGGALAAGAYGFDRWKAGTAGSVSFTNTPASTIVTINSGTLQQVIEGQEVLSGTYTLSWAGTSGGRAYPTGSPTGAYQPSPRTYTFVAGTNYTIEFNPGTLGQVMLQLGSVATPWQPQPYQQEVARCQRFYQIVMANWGGYVTGANGYVVSTGLIVSMRAIPSVVNQQDTSSNFGARTVGANSFMANASATATASGFGAITVVFACSADL